MVLYILPDSSLKVILIYSDNHHICIYISVYLFPQYLLQVFSFTFSLLFWYFDWCLFFYYFTFFICHTARHAELPQPGIEPMPPAVGAWSLNHWTTSEVQGLVFIFI